MNRILLDPEELNGRQRCFFSADDYRAQHLKKILRAQPGQSFEAGILGTTITGNLELLELGTQLELQFLGAESVEEQAKQSRGLRIALGLTRPPVLKRLLRDLASGAVAEISLLQGKLCEGDYSKSHIWQDLRHYLILGAEQGRVNRLPNLICRECSGISVAEFLERVGEAPGFLFVAGEHDSQGDRDFSNAYAVVGPERGWTVGEQAEFLGAGFLPYSLGPFTLRTELAAHAALALYLEGC